MLAYKIVYYGALGNGKLVDSEEIIETDHMEDFLMWLSGELPADLHSLVITKQE